MEAARAVAANAAALSAGAAIRGAASKRQARHGVLREQQVLQAQDYQPRRMKAPQLHVEQPRDQGSDTQKTTTAIPLRKPWSRTKQTKN